MTLIKTKQDREDKTMYDLAEISGGLAVGKVGPREKNGECFALFFATAAQNKTQTNRMRGRGGDGG